MKVRMLGSLEILVRGRPVDLGRPRQQIVLATLLLNDGYVTPTYRLVEAIYDDNPPTTSRTQIHICISALRRLFADHGYPDVIKRRDQGYVFHYPEAEIDAKQFTRLAEEAVRARDEGKIEEAVRIYRQALSLWRGSMFEGMASRLVQSVAPRFTEQRIMINEDCIRLELELGRHREQIAEITALVSQYPLREQLSGMLMTALYRSGRKAEALAAYQGIRQTTIEELGLEPSEELQRLQQAVLSSDKSLDAVDTVTSSTVSEPTEPPAVPRLLPTDIADFTGRAEQVELIRRLLVTDTCQSAVPIIVVTGKPGIGKSTLAVHASHIIADSFPDGQLYVNLHGGSSPVLHPSQVLERFLRALGVPGSEIPNGVEERAEVYRAVLSDRRVLIIFDDVATESQVLPLIPGYPACAVLITSRGRLAGLPGARTLEVTTFDPENSIDLLKRIAGSARIEASPESASTLAQLCGNLPLALRISGARLAAKQSWTIDRLVERLTDEAQRLDELRYGEMGIRTMLTLTYEGISEPARIMLRRLPILNFAHYTDWMAAALVGRSIGDARDLLDELIEAHLVEIAEFASDGRVEYRLHELTRVFARERLIVDESPAQRQEELQRVLRCLLSLAQEAHRMEYGGDFAQVHSDVPRYPVSARAAQEIIGTPMQWFERERSTLVSGVSQAAKAGLTDLCWDLAITSVTLFEARIYHDDWRQTHEVALDAAHQAGNVRGQAAMFYSRGCLHSAEQRFEEAREDFETAVTLFRREEDDQGEALALRDTAYLDRMYGRLAAAETGYRRALEIFRRKGDLASLAFTFHSLARTRLEARDPDGAKSFLRESLVLSKKSGSKRVEAQVHCWLGDAYLRADAVRAAVDEYQQSLTLVSAMDDPLGEAYALSGLGNAAVKGGRLGEASSAFERCIELALRTRSHLAEIRGLVGLGEVGAARGRPDVAVRHLRRALGLCERMHGSLSEVHILTRLSTALASAGNHQEASRAASDVLRLVADMDPVLLEQARADLDHLADA